MANEASSSSPSVWEEEFIGADSGWVEARTSCDHLPSLCSDLSQIPIPDSPCTRCQHPTENWLCLSCKDVLCSRFVNQHMLKHFQETEHCLALSYSDLSVWCFCCDAYLDAQVILQLRPVYEVAHLLKFGEQLNICSYVIIKLRVQVLAPRFAMYNCGSFLSSSSFRYQTMGFFKVNGFFFLGYTIKCMS